MEKPVFVNKVTNIPADWANAVTTLLFDIFGQATTVAEAREAIGLAGSLTAPNQTILVYGSGVPDSTVGENTNFYLDTDTFIIYGPKYGNMWPAGVPLGTTGPQGPAGPAGADGESFALNPQLIENIQYLVEGMQMHTVVVEGDVQRVPIQVGGPLAVDQRRVGVYFPNWQDNLAGQYHDIDHVDLDRVSVVNYAYAYVTPDFKVLSSEPKTDIGDVFYLEYTGGSGAVPPVGVTLTQDTGEISMRFLGVAHVNQTGIEGFVQPGGLMPLGGGNYRIKVQACKLVDTQAATTPITGAISGIGVTTVSEVVADPNLKYAQGQYARLQLLKRTHRDLKTIISIGGPVVHGKPRGVMNNDGTVPEEVTTSVDLEVSTAHHNKVISITTAGVTIELPDIAVVADTFQVYIRNLTTGTGYIDSVPGQFIDQSDDAYAVPVAVNGQNLAHDWNVNGVPNYDQTNVFRIFKDLSVNKYRSVPIDVLYPEEILHNAATDATTRATFAENAVAFMKEHGFDGINLHWTHPGKPGFSTTHYAKGIKFDDNQTNYTDNGQDYWSWDDQAEFSLLLARLREELDTEGTVDGRQYLLSVNAGIADDEVDHTDLETGAGASYVQYVDWIDLKTYDLAGATWGGVHSTTFQAPETEISTVDAIEVKFGPHVPYEKLNLGVAPQTRTFAGTYPNKTGPGIGINGVIEYREAYKQVLNRPDLWSIEYSELLQTTVCKSKPVKGLMYVSVIDGGSGYTNPTVVISGDGTGAEAVAEVTFGVITRVVVTKPGLGYNTITVSVTDSTGDDAVLVAHAAPQFLSIDTPRSMAIKAEYAKTRRMGVVSWDSAGDTGSLLNTLGTVMFSKNSVRSVFELGAPELHTSPEVKTPEANEFLEVKTFKETEDQVVHSKMMLLQPLDVGSGGHGGRDVVTARRNLGLGSLAEQDADDVRFFGGRGRLQQLSVDDLQVKSVRFPLSTVLKTGDYLATDRDYTVRVDTTSSNVTITLPAAATVTGKVMNVKKVDGSANDVVVKGWNTETIDGTNTKTLTSQYETLQVQSNGTGWDVL